MRQIGDRIKRALAARAHDGLRRLFAQSFGIAKSHAQGKNLKAGPSTSAASPLGGNAASLGHGELLPPSLQRA